MFRLWESHCQLCCLLSRSLPDNKVVREGLNGSAEGNLAFLAKSDDGRGALPFTREIPPL